MKDQLQQDGGKMEKYRTLKILQLKADGYSSKEVGPLVGLSGRTVEAILDKLRESYQAKNLIHLMMICKRANLVE